MADVLDQLSTVIGRPVKPLERIQKPAEEKPVEQLPGSRYEAGDPNKPPQSLESVLGRKLQPAKLDPLVSARFKMYTQAQKNGFSPEVAAKTAMAEAGTMQADPSTWRKVTSAIRNVPTGTGKVFGDLGNEVSSLWDRLNNPLGATDAQWEKTKTDQKAFLDKQLKLYDEAVKKAPVGVKQVGEFTSGATKRLPEFAEGFTSPVQIALMYGTLGRSALVRTAAALGIPGAAQAAGTLSTMMQLNFQAQMVEGAATGLENMVKHASNGDWESAGGDAVEGLISGLMAKGLATHEVANERVRGDLEKTARQRFGPPIGNPVTAAITSRFDQLDPFHQGMVIHDTVHNTPEYAELLAKQAAGNQKEIAKHQQKVTDYHDRAISQAFEPDAAKRGFQHVENQLREKLNKDVADLHESGRQHYIKQVVATLKAGVERNAAVEAERQQEEEQARQEGRDVRPQRKASEREQQAVKFTNAQQIEGARSAAAETRRKANEAQTERTANVQRPVDGQIDGSGHATYRANYFGEENTFGVAGDAENLGVYRQTPRGKEYLDKGGFYAEKPDQLYLAPDHETADTLAKISSLRHTAESEGNGDEESLLAGLEQKVASGETSASDARKELGIPEQIELPTEVDALRAGNLKGPLADRSESEYYDELMNLAADSNYTPEETEAMLQQAGVLARAETENNLHHIAQSGDYITSKRGVRWSLDSRGMLHPDDGGAAVPLMKNGHYTGQALKLAQSGRVGYAGRTREQRRADTAKQRAIQARLDTLSEEENERLRQAQLEFGLELAPENMPSERQVEKRERAQKFGPPTEAAQTKQAAIGIAELIRNALEKTGAAEVVDKIAKDNGVDAEEVIRQKIAKDDTPAGKAASLQVGDKITDPFRKDRPWVVEESKSGGLQLRSGNANPLPLDRLNPSERVTALLRNGGLEQNRPLTDQDLTHVAFDSPHVAYRNEMAEKVRAIASGSEKVPEAKSQAQAKAQLAAAERVTAAVVSKAHISQADALEAPPGTTEQEAEAKADEANTDAKTAEAAKAQEADAFSKTVPEDAFPPRAPVTVGLRGNSGVIKQNGRELPMHYEMLPLEAPLTSHEWQGNVQVPRAGYPSDLQPRTISESESKENALRAQPRATDENGVSIGYDFAEYADRTINASMGPSILDASGYTVSGNTRLEIMRKHLQNLQEIQDPIDREVALSLFREDMNRLGRENGITPPNSDVLHGVFRVLDRPIETLREAAELGRLFNKPISVQMTESAKGVSYSKSLTDENLATLGRLVEEHDGLTPAIKANPEYFANLVQNNFGIVPSEYANWFETDKSKGLVLNDAGQSQFSKALLGTIFKDTSVLSRVEDSAAYRSLERALPYLIKMRSIPERNLTSKLIDAVTAAADTMHTDPGLSLSKDKWAATYRPDQVEFLGMETERPPEPDRMVETIWRALTGGPRTFNDRLKNWIGEESAANESMFAVHQTPAEIFSNVFRKELKESGHSHGEEGEVYISQAEYDSLLRNVELSEDARKEAKRAEEGKPPKKEKVDEKPKAKGLTPPPIEPEKPATPENKIAEAKAEKGYVTPDELRSFLSAHESTKEHVSEIMRTVQMMAEYVFDADPPVGMDRKEALGWILKERVAKLEAAEKGKGRGSYSDPLIEKGIGTGILKLTKAADETTFIHEFAHVIFPMLSKEDHENINTIHHEKIPQWDQKTPLKGDSYRGLSEKFAGALEKFLRDQNPRGFSAEVKMVLAKVKEMFRKAYMRFRGDPLSNFNLTDEAKGIFTDMFHIEDLDISDSWHDEVKKARAESKRMTRPEDEPHPVVKTARDIGATGIRKTFAGKVEDTVGDRVDPKKPTTVFFFPNQETANAAWLDVGTEGSKIQNAELIAAEDGTYGIRVNTPSTVPSDVLFQEVQRKHPGLELADLKKQLAELPASASPAKKAFLKIRVQNLENEIRSKYGTEERKPVETKQAAQEAVKEKNNARATARVVHELRRLPEGSTRADERQGTGKVHELPVVGLPDNAKPRADRGPLPGTRSLTAAKPVTLESLPERGESVGILEGDKFSASEWVAGNRKAGLPENAPPPTVTISRETASQLKYAGQKQVVQLAMSALEQGDGFVVASATGSGKCLGKGTPVLMYDGTIKKVENIRIGDQLMGPDSGPRNVRGLAHGWDNMYRIVPVKGDPYVVNEPHILSLKMTPTGSKHPGGQSRIVNIPVSEYLKQHPTFKHRAKGYRVGVDFPWERVPMDPYILGMWLGDGTSTNAAVTTKDEEIQAFWQIYIESLGGWIRVDDNNKQKCPTYTAAFYKKGKTPVPNQALNILQELNLISNKHVPHNYKANSEQVRLAVLAGLIDTDGHLDGNNDYDFVSKWKVLADDVAFLCRSLGLAAYVSECKKTCVNNGKEGTYFRVLISGDTSRIPVRIWQKRAKPRRQKKSVLVTGIKVEPIGVGQYFGFEIDGDHLFLLGDFTVTHNTYTTSGIVKEFLNANPGAKVLVLTKNLGLLKNSARIGKESFGFETNNNVPRGTVDKGVHGATYQRLLTNDVYKNTDWDLVIADESGEMRNWFREESQQGKAAMEVIDKSKKAVYSSATPFHSPSEYGYLKKLNLWPKNGFDKWIADNFAHEKIGDKVFAKLDPAKQAKLRQQLIERGQFVSQMISYEGYTTHFGVVPVDDEIRRSLNRIHEGVSRAKAQLIISGKKGLADRLSAFEATYTKAFLERSRLPQAIDLIKKGLEQGWHPIVFSETTSEDLFRREEDGEPGTYRKLDQEMGGELSRIIPPFANVYDELKASFGERIADFSGLDNTDAAREAAKQDFLSGRVPALYTTYAAGGIGVSLHDEVGDKPRLAIYLGPPYSGVLLEQAMGRAWRFGVKSNVLSVFLATDSEPDIQLMATKIGPRMRAVRASVLGERDSLGAVMGNYSEEEKLRERQDMLAYDQGNEVKVDAQSFQRRDKRNVKIDNWSAIQIPHADTAKHKGMQIKTAGKDGDWATLYQSKNRFSRPPMSIGEMAAQRMIDQTATATIEGKGLSPSEPILQVDPADKETFVGGAAAVASSESSIPVDRDNEAVARMAMERMLLNPATRHSFKWNLQTLGYEYVGTPEEFAEQMAMVKTQEAEQGEDHRVLYLPIFTNQEVAIRDIGWQSNSIEPAKNIVRMNQSFAADTESKAAEFVSLALDAFRDAKLNPRDKKVMAEVWDVALGEKVSANEAINQVAQSLSPLHEIIHGEAADAGVAVTTPDGREVPFKDFPSKPGWMPRFHDWNAELEDPLTKKTYTLKEVMGKTFPEKQRERILKEKLAQSKAKVGYEDWLAELKQSKRLRTPVLGHMHRTRNMDFPFIKKDWESLARYYDQAAEAIAIEKNFGHGLKKLNEEIGKIKSDNGKKAITGMFRSLLTPEHDSDAFSGRLYNKMTTFEMMSKMTLSATKVPFHVVHAPMALGGKFSPVLKAGAKFLAHPKEFMEHAAYVGTVTREMNPYLLLGDAPFRGLAHNWLRATGFNMFYRWGRALAGASARVYLEQYALKKLIQVERLRRDAEGPGAMITSKKEDLIRRVVKDNLLIGDHAIDQAILRGSWAKDDLDKAEVAFANMVMFSEHNSLQMPQLARLNTEHAWLNNAVRMTYALQTFAVKETSFLRQHLFDEVVIHKNFRPLIWAMVAEPILGQALTAMNSAYKAGIQRGIEQATGKQHKKDPWDKYLEILKDDFDHGTLGILRFVVDGAATSLALDRLKRYGDATLDGMMGEQQRARASVSYWKSDEAEEAMGPDWSTLVWTPLTEMSEEFNTEIGHKNPALDQKWHDTQANFWKWMVEEFPILREEPHVMEWQSKKRQR